MWLPVSLEGIRGRHTGLWTMWLLVSLEGNSKHTAFMLYAFIFLSIMYS